MDRIMTTLRRQRTLLGFGLTVALCLTVGAGPWKAGHVAAATTERVVVDQRTGLAIHGFDPVAYFTDAEPKIGLPEFELRHGGAAWRFRNDGNRAAFADRPDVYAPRFGGYDPVGIARGAGRDGHPEIWLIVEQRLYLFYSAEARQDFEGNSAAILSEAEDNWADVMRTLAP